MNIKRILKTTWNKSKISFLITLKTVVFLLVFNYLRLGSHTLAPIRSWLETQVRSNWNPTVSELKELINYAEYAIDVFHIESTEDLKEKYHGTYNADFYHVHTIDNTMFFIIRKANQLFVSIRGSVNDDNYISNLDAELEKDEELETLIHSGYRDIAIKIADYVESFILPYDQIHLTGASLGAAVATIVGWYLDDRNYDVRKIVAFDSPRISDSDYSHLPIITILNKQDPVAYIPSFTLFGKYRHQGKRIVYESGSWYVYKDDDKSDLLLSWVMFNKSLDIGAHMKFQENLKTKLNTKICEHQ